MIRQHNLKPDSCLKNSFLLCALATQNVKNGNNCSCYLPVTFKDKDARKRALLLSFSYFGLAASRICCSLWHTQAGQAPHPALVRVQLPADAAPSSTVSDSRNQLVCDRSNRPHLALQPVFTALVTCGHFMSRD